MTPSQGQARCKGRWQDGPASLTEPKQRSGRRRFREKLLSLACQLTSPSRANRAPLELSRQGKSHKMPATGRILCGIPCAVQVKLAFLYHGTRPAKVSNLSLVAACIWHVCMNMPLSCAHLNLSRLVPVQQCTHPSRLGLKTLLAPVGHGFAPECPWHKASMALMSRPLYNSLL